MPNTTNLRIEGDASLFSTHLSVLEDYFAHFGRIPEVVEYGPGLFSTELLLRNCDKCVTIEQGQNVPPAVNDAWWARVRDKFAGRPNCEILRAPGDDGWRALPQTAGKLTFVDGLGQARVPIIRHEMARGVETIIAHDTEASCYGWDQLRHIPQPHHYRELQFTAKTPCTTVWTLNDAYAGALLAKGYVERTVKQIPVNPRLAEVKAETWVSISTIEDDYLAFYEPVAAMWKKFGFKTYLTVVGDVDERLENEFGIVHRIKRADLTGVQIEPLPAGWSPSPTELSLRFQAQVARMYAARFIRGAMLLSDLDSMPLQADYFDILVSRVAGGCVSISRENPYQGAWAGDYCMMWLAAKAEDFALVFEADCSFEEFCRKVLAQSGGVLKFHSDEIFLTKQIKASGLRRVFCDDLPVRRVDKLHFQWFGEWMRKNYYTDSHLPRPFSKHSVAIKAMMREAGYVETPRLTPFDPFGGRSLGLGT